MPNLVGIGNSQVPTNAMLGGLAYQDSVGEIDIDKIKAKTGDTAVDIFVYDTHKDSDGGAWRHRTQNTSWYNEGASEHRGARKQFPAVAVLVVTSGNMTIYDGDDPNLPMWMIFTSSNTTWLKHTTSGPNSVVAMNGNIVTCGAGAAGRLSVVNFISDNGYVTEAGYTYRHSGIITRNTTGVGPTDTVNPLHIVNIDCKDVAITVLPNAPIDAYTGLPIPTIAVATEGGFSVIKDDGLVIDKGVSSTATNEVAWYKGKYLLGSGPEYWALYKDLSEESSGYISGTADLYSAANQASWDKPQPTGKESQVVAAGDLIAGGSATAYTGHVPGLSLKVPPPDLKNGNSSLLCEIRKNYNTGWMVGAIKGAFLSDTDTTDATYSTVADDWATASAWTKQSSITISSTGSGTSGTLSITGNGTGSNVYFFNTITVEANTDYVVSITFGAENANTFVINTTQYSAGAGVLLDINALSGLRRGGHFNSGSNTTLYIQGWQQSSTATTITNLVIQKVSEKDRSVHNKGLQVFGTITKKPVATGAELVSYSGWSGSNYIEQPYNSDLDFGSGDWSFNFWVNPNDSSTGSVLMSRWSYNVDSSLAGRIGIYFNSGNVRFDLTDDGASSYQGITGTNGIQDTTGWHMVNILRRGPNAEMWVDGILDTTTALTSISNGSYSNSNAILEIGDSNGMGDPDAGIELALIRISASAPSEEQIKKMYNDEKCLFHENAKCTLYGTSANAVTGLAFDDTNDVLHVGTSAGRSEFQGLVRINNTTTAVTTAISASDGLVAEQ